MSRLSKLLLVSALVLFVLACNLVSGPLDEVENAASTAQAFASAMPLETLQSISTALPVQTLEAMPSALPEIGNFFEPSGKPVDQWYGLPVMPQATAGEEFGDSVYSFTVPASAAEVQDFYSRELEGLGWTSPFELPVSETGGIMVFQNGDELLTITVAPDQSGSGVDVILQR